MKWEGLERGTQRSRQTRQGIYQSAVWFGGFVNDSEQTDMRCLERGWVWG